MPIIVSGTTRKSYPPASAGPHVGICVDVLDMGLVESTYDKKTRMIPKIRLVWQIAEEREDGKRFTVSRMYTKSLHEKATLRGVLESWRGRAFNEEELKGFDLDNLLGVCAFLNLIHADKGGTTYANVSAVMKLPKGTPAITVKDYVRICDRQPDQAEAVPAVDESFDISDSDVPF